MRPSRRPSLASGRFCVVCAWRPEVRRLERRLPLHLRRRVTFHTVGVGLVEAASGAARLLARQRPAAVLLVGTTGVYPGHGHALPPGSAAIIDEMVLLPRELPGRSAYLPDRVPRRARSSPALVRALHRATHLPMAKVACPLAITASVRAAATAARMSGCTLENLEAFAVARAAAEAEIPFAAVLGVANHVGPDGHRQWRQNARAAAAAACDALLTFFTSPAAGKPRPKQSLT